MISVATSKFAEKTAVLSPAKSVPVSPAIAGAAREGDELQPLDRDAHQLGRERILAQRLPGAPGARQVDEIDAR